MAPPYSLKDKYNQSIKPWLFALGICLVSHFLFYSLFSTDYKYTEETQTNRPRIVMMPQDARNVPESFLNIINWMNDVDTSLMTLPNNKLGYSSILLSDESVQFQKPSILSQYYQNIFSKQSFEMQNISVSPIPVAPLDISYFLNKLSGLQTASIPKVQNDYLNHNTISYPYLTELFSGQNIPFKFFGLGENYSVIFKEKPQKPTILELFVPEDKSLFLIGRILESSGSAELDSIALNNLSVWQCSEDIRNNFKNGLIAIKIDWMQQLNNLQKGNK